MRKTREILRLKWVLRRSHREIARATGAGLGTISETATRATATGLDWAEARATATTVEIFHRGQRIASHRRSYERARHTTTSEHMPKAHQQHAEWSPSRFARWASTIGPKTEELVRAIIAERPHPEHGYRSCLGILRLGKRYGAERLEAACHRALVVRARSFKRV